MPGCPFPKFPGLRRTRTSWERRSSSWSACRAGVFGLGAACIVFARPGSALSGNLAAGRATAGATCIWSIGRQSLPDWEKPRPLSEELERWTKILRHAEDPDWFAAGTRLGTLLASRMPDEAPVGLVHGDFQPGNILYENGRAGGLIDWELAAIGAQGLDLGWMLMMSTARHGIRIGGRSHRYRADDLIEAYREAGGPARSEHGVVSGSAHYRLGAIACLNVKLHRTGKRPDALWERFAPSISFLFARGIELAERATDRDPEGNHRMIDFELPAELAASARSGRTLSSPTRSFRMRTTRGKRRTARRSPAPGARRLGARGRACCRRTRQRNTAASGSIIAAWRWSSRPPAGRRWARWRSISRRPTRATSICSTSIATPEQKARWLAPLVRGEIRSVFSMTETVTRRRRLRSVAAATPSPSRTATTS